MVRADHAPRVLARVPSLAASPKLRAMAATPYRGRLAPSPTGPVHFGTARTALLAWLAARAAGGTVVLRIEDLDAPRVVAGAEQAIGEDLRWLGLHWDEGPDAGGPFGPYRQSERGSLYERVLGALQAQGLLFPCTCTRAELARTASAPHGELGPRYPGTCRRKPPRRDRPASLRFHMERSPGFRDRLYGEQPETEGDDFVVRRSDGQYAYQLAVVADDLAMGITEVVRGADLLSSTPRQLALYRALGAEPPSFLHVPLVLGAGGARLAKRHGAPAIAERRAAGEAPESVLGQLASSVGLATPGELVRAQDLVARFDVACLPREPTVL
jgi:glutamyl-tRNA synthetase